MWFNGVWRQCDVTVTLSTSLSPVTYSPETGALSWLHLLAARRFYVPYASEMNMAESVRDQSSGDEFALPLLQHFKGKQLS